MSSTSNTNTELLTRFLENSLQDSVFQPTPDQRKAKSSFWAVFGTDPEGTLGPAENLVTALRFGGDKRIRQWWDTPGFQDWFFNRDEFRQRVEYLANLALDNLEEILTARNVTSTDKLNAIKILMQVGRKLPTGQAQADSGALPDAISRMTRSQLEAYIQSSLRLLPAVTTSSVDPAVAAPDVDTSRKS